jgi:hypothetical protein
LLQQGGICRPVFSEEIRMKYLVLVFALLSGAAFADNTALSGSAAQSAALSGSYSGAQQGNQQAITINGAPIPTDQTVRHEGTSTVKTVATVYAPPIGVTAPCLMGISGGVTVVGVGASLGASVEDKECTMRETARLLHAMGQPVAAAKVMCNNAMAAQALGEATCLKPVYASTAPVQPTSICQTAQTNDDRILAERNHCLRWW